VDPRFVDANGLRFGVLEQGAGPLVLLLHGFPDTAHTWEHALPAFAAAGYRAVAPFMRGYAPTAIPRDGRYDIDALGSDVLALIGALGEDRAVVVGHDWGAAAGYAAATLAPARVRLLVTLGVPHPRGFTPSPVVAWKLRHLLALRAPGAARRVARADFALLDELVQRWSPAWQVPPGETARVKQTFREPGVLDAALGYYRALRVRGVEAYQQPVPVPTIAFAGEHDIISPRAYEKVRHCFTSAYEVVQVPGGHAMHREHPAVVIPELVHHVADVVR